MIINFFLNVIVLILGAFFSLFPEVTTLPQIVGYDIDTALVNGVGQLHFFMAQIWPLGVMFQGALAILSYHVIKIGYKTLFGSRAPQ